MRHRADGTRAPGPFSAVRRRRRPLRGPRVTRYDARPMVRDRVIEIVRAALARGAAEGRWPAVEVSFAVEAPRDPRHGDFAVNAAMVLAKPAGKPPRELAAALVEALRAVDAAGELASRRGGRPRLRQPAPRPRPLAARHGAGGGRGGRLRPDRGGPGQEGHRRVRLGQPDRPDARRPRPQRGDRRRRAEPAPLGRLRRDARVLRQRLRRPGADPGPLGPPPLPGGPRPRRWPSRPRPTRASTSRTSRAALEGRGRATATSTPPRPSGSTSSATGPWSTCSA